MSNSVSESEPSSSDLLVLEGIRLFNQGLADDAERAFLDALKSDPNHAGANAFIAKVERERDNIDAALAYLDKAIASYPGAPYLYDRAEIKITLDRYDEAIEDLKLCILNDKMGLFTIKSLALIAMSLVQFEKFREAIGYLEKIIELDPTNSGAFALRAVAHGHLGEELAARNDRAQAIEYGFNPEDPFKSFFASQNDPSSATQLSAPNAVAYLDSSNNLHLSFRRHSRDSVSFGFAQLTEEHDAYKDLIRVLDFARGKHRSLSDVDQALVDLSALCFSLVDYKTGQISIAEFAELSYVKQGVLQTIQLENTLTNKHTLYALAYALDNELGISTSADFHEALKQDLASMKALDKAHLVGLGLGTDTFASNVFATTYCVLREVDDALDKKIAASFPKTSICVQRLIDQLQAQSS